MVAGSQLSCALDPPRQALCLRMACRVPYPYFLPYILPYIPYNVPYNLQKILKDHKRSPRRARHREAPGTHVDLPRGFQDAPRRSKRPQDASRTPLRHPKIPPRRSKRPSRRPKTSLRRSKRPSRAAKTAKMTPKTPPKHDFQGFWVPKWRFGVPKSSHVGTKIVSKSDLMLKQPESQRILFFQ